MSRRPAMDRRYLLILSIKLPTAGRQNREQRFIMPPTMPIKAALAPRLSEKPVMRSVTSMGLAK